MKNGRLQCKDIPDSPILEFLDRLDGQWSGWWKCSEHDVRTAMPNNLPDSLVLAKMRRLIERGLVSGCACGCRGDFEITKRGKEVLMHRAKT